MQIDAIDLQDLGELGIGGELPPPLPPKKTSKLTWIIGALVVLLAAGLGIGAGFFLLAGSSDDPPPAAAPSAPPAPDEADVVQMDEVVFGAEAE